MAPGTQRHRHQQQVQPAVGERPPRTHAVPTLAERGRLHLRPTVVYCDQQTHARFEHLILLVERTTLVLNTKR